MRAKILINKNIYAIIILPFEYFVEVAMTLNLFIIGFVLMIACAFLATEFLRAFYHKRFKRALLFKGLASCCFVVLGAYSFASSEFSVPRLLIFIGLCWGIIGDEIIALCQIFPKNDTAYFIGGGAFFIVGHVLYIVAVLMFRGVDAVALVASAVLIALLCLVYERSRKYLIGEMKASLLLYIGVVIFFTAVGAGSVFKEGTLSAVLFTLGGVLFTISDNVLFAFKFGSRPKYRQNVILHVAYYLAQFMIAFSIAGI